MLHLSTNMLSDIAIDIDVSLKNLLGKLHNILYYLLLIQNHNEVCSMMMS